MERRPRYDRGDKKQTTAGVHPVHQSVLSAAPSSSKVHLPLPLFPLLEPFQSSRLLPLVHRQRQQTTTWMPRLLLGRILDGLSELLSRLLNSNILKPALRLEAEVSRELLRPHTCAKCQSDLYSPRCKAACWQASEWGVLYSGCGVG
ncbi:uncharacterized protein EKO05_0010666 [Ascochyta rabiei]|uniref:uncharacterized protein n=1 Tax=Didymella rabiei TaxID=5454 RepID=UPI0021FB4DFF|nr:uncharacterized protein EKO05_0010666 [Ascochyta rabiei]UPX20435.1 hypothetical protein EKO05_0010666 [Ascochyta rabiei]